MNQKKLLKKFLNNACNAIEAEAVTKLLEENPALLDSILSEQEWTTHLNNFDNKKSYSNTVKIAFMAIVILFSSIVIQQKNSTDQFFFPNNYYSNNTDSSKTIILEDSSIISLAAKSAFYSHLDENQSIRFIELIQGEIKSKVKKDKSRPFVVKSGSIHTTALGTEFSVNYHSEQLSTDISLHEGRIKVATQNSSTILWPGDAISFNDNIIQKSTQLNNNSTAALLTNSMYNKPHTTAPSITKEDNFLLMNNTTLSDALDFINQELATPIAYKHREITSFKVTGKFALPTSQTLTMEQKETIAKDILEVITSVNPLSTKKQHNTIILFNKPKN